MKPSCPPCPATATRTWTRMPCSACVRPWWPTGFTTRAGRPPMAGCSTRRSRPWTSTSCCNRRARRADHLIKHVAMWKVSGDTPEARRARREKVKQQFKGLRSLIPDLLALEVGLDVSGVDYPFHLVLYTEFESPQ